ncbi:MAG: LamG domain-containing protein [Phycisphaerae bacterium]|nr:LamG domain-containing protein [Phycisphaerae bacterium]
MCRKVICMASIALVVGLMMASTTRADLVGQWKFDEGSGTTAYDSSGNGHDGTLVGGAAWTPDGRFGGGLELDGTSGYVSVPSFELTTDTITFVAWVNGWKAGDWAPLISSRVVGQCEMNFGDNDTLHYTWNGDSADTWGWTGGPVIPQDTWTMLAVTIDPAGATAYVYTDDDGLTQTTNAIAHIEETVGALQIGYSYDPRYVRGIMDEAAVYDHALTEDEIVALATVPLPLARDPNPVDGAMLADTWVTLSWRPGDLAVSHDVYLGENFDDVSNGTGDAFRGNQASTMFIAGFVGFPYPEGLVPGTTYYWRVDGVNEADPNSPWKGDVWSFWIPPKKAYDAVPADGSQFIPADVTLEWTAGFNAKLHTVYFGDDFDTVNNAAGGVAQTTTSFAPSALELSKTYYWRVDEFDPPFTHKGDVLSFTTLPDVPITDPALMGWWTFEEGTGAIAVDWSGHGNHGTLIGDPQWVAGFDGGALEFGGDNYVDTGYTENLATYTIACWVKSPQAPSGAAASGPLHREQNYQFNWNHADVVFRGAAAMNAGGVWQAASYMPLQANTWYYLAATYDGSAFKAYRDGVLITTTPVSGAPNAESGSLKLGRHATAAANFFTGTVDEARVYNRALTAEEIQKAMKGDTSLAWSPNPGNGTLLAIGQASPLSWTAGDNAAQHDVYFGTDKDAMSNADASDATGTYRGRQSSTTFNSSSDVEWGGGPYYWRVDESNTDGTISTGKIWTFAVTDYLLVEDFEDFNDYPPDEIWNTWIDGFGTTNNGSTAGYADPDFAAGGHYVETSIVNGGAQSMPLFYDNNLKFSEATKTLVYPRNWTEQGVGVLSLWIRGASANAAERVYVALNGVAVYHEDPAAAHGTSWTEWPIPLSAFADKGVNLAAVNTISIGLGDKNNITAGGSGVLYVDDIRLYRSAP